MGSHQSCVWPLLSTPITPILELDLHCGPNYRYTTHLPSFMSAPPTTLSF